MKSSIKSKVRSSTEFLNQVLTRPTVLIIEPNPYHGEVLPGFTYLFQTLGYEVHLLIRNEVVEEDPFVIYPKAKLPVIYSGSDEGMKQLLMSGTVKQYDLLFFSTNVLWEGTVHHSSYEEYLGYSPQGKRDSIFVEHNLLCLDEDKARTIYEQGRLFTLLAYPFEGATTKSANPHYFGEISSLNEPVETIKILVLGSSSRDPKNLDRLFSAVRSLLIDNEYSFEISIAGGGVLDIPHDLKDTVRLLNRLDFEEYYSIVESHHYLLTLIDTNSDDIIHRKYAHGTTSGTVQISLGFKKPMIIDLVHADAYEFNDRNAIVYPGDDVKAGLRQAIKTSTDEYNNMVKALELRSASLFELAKTNLREVTGGVSAEKLRLQQVHQYPTATVSKSRNGLRGFASKLWRVVKP